MRCSRRLLIAFGLGVYSVLGALLEFSAAQDITLEGGDATVDDDTGRAYDHPLPNMTQEVDSLLHDLGQTGFLRDFSRVKVGGAIRVGPQFNAPSCASCHGGNGRGALRISSRARASDTVVKVSIPSGKPQLPGGPVPVPKIGTQLHDHALKGLKTEARISISWNLIQGIYGDGTPYELRTPRLKVSTSGARLSSRTLFSLRRAPPVFGSGLLEAVSSGDILALADPVDSNSDGISGRANVVWDVAARSTAIGRFGFKAGAPTLKQQVAAAYATDMGVTNPLFRGTDKKPDISNRILDATTFYTASLAVPRARRQDDPAVQRGKASFTSFGCAQCHTAELRTTGGATAALSNLTIHPFTDLLLHDMGSGLADGRSEFQASGSEWRTTPLWGIGLSGVVLGSRPESYLHDGRARTLEEAILWHGGEGAGAKDRFVAASASERDELIQFLRSL